MKTSQVVRRSLALMAGALCLSPPLWARDTDIYTFKNPQQNAYLLVDNSGSMSAYVYDHNIDYGAIMDQVGLGREKKEKDRLYLVKPSYWGNLVIKKNPKTKELYDESQDITHYQRYYEQFFDNAVKYTTNCKLEGDEFVISGSGQVTITKDGDKIKINNKSMPDPMNLKVHSYKELADTGIVMDEGLAGMLKAPGYHTTGFNVNKGTLNNLSSCGEGSWIAYILATGNYINFSKLTFKKKTSGFTYDISGDDKLWPEMDYNLRYPATAGEDYSPNLTGTAGMKKMDVVEAKKVKLHFKVLDLGNGDKLHIELEGKDGVVTDKMVLEGPKQEQDYWTENIDLDGAFQQTLRFRLESNEDNSVGKGYWIDKARSYDNEKYRFKTRLDVSKEAIQAVVNRYGDDINWGVYQYLSDIGAKHGNNQYMDLDPDAVDDSNPKKGEEHRKKVIKFVNDLWPEANTPSQMALQDLWVYGFNQNPKRDKLAEDCKKTLIIHLSDGFPTQDTNTCRFKDGGLEYPKGAKGLGCFDDIDGDQLGNNFDDIATWIATHSWASYTDAKTGKQYKPGDEIDPKKDNPKNAITHNIAFGARMNLLKNASEEVNAKTGSGLYLIASNKGQLVAAFSAMVTGQAASASFSSPTISTSSENLLESGFDMYMPLFQPLAAEPWLGNLKKYKRGGELDPKTGKPLETRPDATKIYSMEKDTNNPPQYVEATTVDVRDYWANDNSISPGNNAVDYLKQWCPETNPTESGITSGGVGTVMLRQICEFYHSNDYWRRRIYFLNQEMNFLSQEEKDRDIIKNVKNATLTHFEPRLVPPALLGVSSEMERNQVVNFIHGYTRATKSQQDPAPMALRAWPMGPILHSLPVTFDKTIKEDQTSTETRRRIVVVGSSFGMLHFFLDGKYKAEKDPKTGKTIYSSYSDDPATVNGKTVIELGRELFSFIPPTAMKKLKDMGQPGYQDATDGLITLYKEAPADDPHGEKEVKYVIFGERRGGNAYYCLDVQDPNPTNWKLKWIYQPEELGQTWSSVQIAAIRTDVDPDREDSQYKNDPDQYNQDAAAVWKNVIIFSGGYDEREDNFPEPFEDVNKNGSPFVNPQGTDDTPLKDLKYTDENGNKKYDWHNLADGDKMGRGIFVALLDDPSKEEYSKSGKSPILPFSVTHDAPDDKKGTAQTLSEMKYCFPASPSVLTEPVIRTVNYKYKDANGKERQGRKQVQINALRAIYAVDVYANVYKVSPLHNKPSDLKPDPPEPPLTLVEQLTKTDLPVSGWQVRKLFSAEEGVSDRANIEPDGTDEARKGRKAFYSPTISLGGTVGSFHASNFRKTRGLSFEGTDNMATIFFGTGDREHPKSSMIKNRIYAVYDDGDISAVVGADEQSVSTAPYTEKNLLNLTCKELKLYKGDLPAEKAKKREWQDKLVDDFLENEQKNPQRPFEIDVDSDDGFFTAFTSTSVVEDDRKGWFIMLDEQGNCDPDEFKDKDGKSYSPDKDDINDKDNHAGEQVLSKPLLYNGVLYFTSYQNKPSNDPCVGMSSGNGFVYALDYQNASAAYAWPRTNDIVSYTGRSVKHTGIGGIPSGFSLIFHGRQVMAVASMGSTLKGAGQWPTNDPSAGEPGFPIDTPPLGLKQYYWFDQNSQARETQED